MVSEMVHNYSSLVGAAKAGNAKLALQLLMDGTYKHVDERDERIGGTALFWAASWGDLDLALNLYNRGAGINAINKRHATPLHVAVDRGRDNVVRFLISQGANLDAQTDTQETACHLAAYRKRPELLRLLIASGSDLTLRNNKGKTSLHVALASHCQETIRVFTENSQKSLSSSSLTPIPAKTTEGSKVKSVTATDPPVESTKPDVTKAALTRFSGPRRPEQHTHSEQHKPSEQPCSHHHVHSEVHVRPSYHAPREPHVHTEVQSRALQHSQPELRFDAQRCCSHHPDRQSYPPEPKNGRYWSTPEHSCYRLHPQNGCYRAHHEWGCYRPPVEHSCYRAAIEHDCYRSNPEYSCCRPHPRHCCHIPPPCPRDSSYHPNQAMTSRPELRRSVSHHAASRHSRVVSMITPDSSMEPESFLYRSCSDDTMVTTVNALGKLETPTPSSSAPPDTTLYMC